jgi:cytochrome c oxidase subunit 6a
MFSQRNIARLSQRASQQMRSAPVRSTVQRRFNSAEAKPSWIVDNEFNRERAAVKHHAASTSGAYPTQLIHHQVIPGGKYRSLTQ